MINAEIHGFEITKAEPLPALPFCNFFFKLNSYIFSLVAAATAATTATAAATAATAAARTAAARTATA